MILLWVKRFCLEINNPKNEIKNGKDENRTNGKDSVKFFWNAFSIFTFFPNSFSLTFLQRWHFVVAAVVVVAVVVVVKSENYSVLKKSGKNEENASKQPNLDSSDGRCWKKAGNDKKKLTEEMPEQWQTQNRFFDLDLLKIVVNQDL